MGGDAGRGQAVLLQHALHRGEAIERRGIERGAEESPRVLGVADAARRQAQILELGEPAGDRRPRRRSRRARGGTRSPRRPSHICTRRRGRRRVRAAASPNGPVERHEGVIAVDHDPRPVRPAEGGQLLDRLENPPAAEQHLADEDEVVPAASRSGEEAVGEAVERLGRRCARPRPALLFPARELPARAVEFAVAGEDSQSAPLRGAAVTSRTRKSCVFEAKTIASGIALPSSRATCACASGQTSSITLSHLRSARRAASSRPRSGRRSWRRARGDGCARRNAAARDRRRGCG